MSQVRPPSAVTPHDSLTTGAGRGLFTTSDLAVCFPLSPRTPPDGSKPGETLLSIPPSAMVNPLTLPPSTIPTHLFPQPISHSHRLKRPRKSDPAIRRLNTTQLLTLHLALARDKLGRHPSRYEVYLDTLPTSFRPWHPLTWHVPPDAQAKIKKEAKEWEWWRTLARLIPRGATSYLQEVRRRYEEDLSVLREILVRLALPTPAASEE